MILRSTVCITGVLGAAAWITRSVLSSGEATGSGLVLDRLHWVGLVLFGVALAGAGVVMVRRAPLWLRAVVAAALTLLVWSVFELARPLAETHLADAHVVDAVAGALVALACLWQVKTAAPVERPGRRATPARRATRGSHAR